MGRAHRRSSSSTSRPPRNPIPARWGAADVGLAVGIDRVLVATIGNISVYDKASGAELLNTTNDFVFGPIGSHAFTRAFFDPHSQRFFVFALQGTEFVHIAVSRTSDPLGSWFATSFDATQGTDATLRPEYLSAGFDPNGIYLSLLMFELAPGSDITATVFAVDKAPLVAPAAALGTVTAFRDLANGFGIQPCETYEDSGGEYLVNIFGLTNSFRVQQITGPLTAPTLSLVGTDTAGSPFRAGQPTASFGSPPAQGSNSPLDVADYRLLKAIYHDGHIWTTRHTGVFGGMSIQWFDFDAASATVLDWGLLYSSGVADNGPSEYLPAIGVNARGDMLLTMNISSETEFIGTYVSGRPTPPTRDLCVSDPMLVRAGAGPQNPPDDFWGLYSDTARDPVDPDVLWTAGTYGRQANRWGVQVAQFRFPVRPADELLRRRSELGGIGNDSVGRRKPERFDQCADAPRRRSARGSVRDLLLRSRPSAGAVRQRLPVHRWPDVPFAGDQRRWHGSGDVGARCRQSARTGGSDLGRGYVALPVLVSRSAGGRGGVQPVGRARDRVLSLDRRGIGPQEVTPPRPRSGP